MHHCQCMQHLKSFPHFLSKSYNSPVVKRLYSTDPKWTSQAEEQFLSLFKLKEKPAPEPKQTTQTTPKTPPPPPPTPASVPIPPPPPIHTNTIVRQTPTSAPHTPLRPSLSTVQGPIKYTRFNRAPLPPARHHNLSSSAPSRISSSLAEPPPTTEEPYYKKKIATPMVSELYARAGARMEPGEHRPSQPFEKLEAEERAPQLSDDESTVIKLWIEGLPITDEVTLQDALSLLVEHPIKVSDVEIVTDRGMIATRSVFVTVDLGINDREKIFYQLENFGLTIKGMRCPVRTAEVKRQLTLIELGPISETTLVNTLTENNISYATYDYQNRNRNPYGPNPVASQYRGAVNLAFRSHAEAHETKKRFDSAEGVTIGDRRIYAMWGPRSGATPLELRTAQNFMRNMIWENRDLRKYHTKVLELNAQVAEPEEFKDLSKTLKTQQVETMERQRRLEALKKELEETSKALIEAREHPEEGVEVDEDLQRAEELIREARDIEAKLHMEKSMSTVQNKSILDELVTTRTLSPHVSKVENAEGLHKVMQAYDEQLDALEEVHKQELKELKAQFAKPKEPKVKPVKEKKLKAEKKEKETEKENDDEPKKEGELPRSKRYAFSF